MPSAMAIPPFKEIAVRTGRRLRLGAALRTLVRLAPAGIRRPIVARLDRARVRRTYDEPLVPAAAFEACCDEILRVLVDRTGAAELGDYLEFGSIQGALVSGRRAAEAVLERLAVGAA